MLQILLILIFIRPFISSAAYPCADAVYSSILLGTLLVWIVRRGLSIEPIRGLLPPLLLFMAGIIVSVVCSGDRRASLETFYTYAQGIFLFAVIASVPSKDAGKIIDALLAAGTIVSLLAIYQYFFGFRLLFEFMQRRNIADPFALDYIARKRSFLPFVTPGVLAGYLAVLIPLAFVSGRKWLMLILLTGALAATKSIGAFGSLAAGLCILFYFDKGKRIWLAAYVTGLMICLGFVVLTRLETQGAHTQPLFSALMRLDYWRETIGIIKAHPFCGVGIGTFNLAHSRYAHNTYLQLCAEIGVAGALSFIWLALAAWRRALKKPVFAAAITVFLVHNFIDFTFFLPETSLIWWLMLGLLF